MNKKLIIKIALIIIALSLLWGVIWSWNITRTVRRNNQNDDLKNQHAIIKNIIVTETQNEKKFWEFYAKTGEYNSEHNQVQLNDVIGNFYDKNEKVVVSFKSKKGSYDEQTKKVVLNGDNLFVGKDGSQLYADEIVWQGEDKDILANGNVQFIQYNKFVVKAKNAVFNSTLTNFKIIGNTKTELYADENSKKKFSQF